ncbi:MAG: hypothetical protein P1P64_10250 [Treponemataceae bacterium]
MKPIFCFYSQFNNFLPRTAIEAEILFAVCLSKKQALTGGKSLACEDKCSKKIGAVLVQQADRRSFEASAVFNFVFFVMLKNKIEQSAAQSCLRKKLSLSEIPTDRTFGNRWSRYKELGKKVPQAYRVYVEDSFLPCDAGDARIFSKEVTHTDNSGDNEEQKVKRYYYHSDHLGSAQFVIDWKGRQYEHIEYTPYGELWTYKSKTAMLFLTTYNNFLAKQPAGLIEETAPGVDKLPFRFTGKELDEETGLYYYGARYLDPKYSRWLSGDPAIGEYIPQAGADASKLPNGGVYNTTNLQVFNYGNNNPIKYNDPTGEIPTPYEAAIMAEHIYTGKSGDVLEGGWTLTDVYALNDKGGSGAIGVYLRPLENGVVEFALVNKGTTNEEDWYQNIYQVFGASNDMKKSIKFAKYFVNRHDGAEVTMIGHSKGGAEAAGNALATNTNAFVFNPAAISAALYGLRVGDYTGNMTAYIVNGEILNALQKFTSVPIDKAIYLNAPKGLNWIDKHSISLLVKLLKED